MTDLRIDPMVNGAAGFRAAGRSRVRAHLAACVAVLALAFLSLLLFRHLWLDGDVWIGNPDRLNSGLKITLHYIRGINAGALQVWDEHEMAGYDSFAMPYTFPNPLTWFAAGFPSDQFLVVESWIAVALQFLAGLAALIFIRGMRVGWLEATVGAVCYSFSVLAVLKVSQNDLSFAVFIVIPIVMAIIRRTAPATAIIDFILLSAALSAMMHWMFLQKASYALLLFGAYAGWRSVVGRFWCPLANFLAAAAVAIVIGLPRVIGIAIAMKQYTREVAGVDLADFSAMYQFQNIRPYEILRWFDGTIFGLSPSDAARLDNNINLTEGFLLATSPVVPFLVVACIATRLFSGKRGKTTQDNIFYALVLVFTIAVVESKIVQYLVYLLFLRVDFTHARILIAGLLPMCALVASVLWRWHSGSTAASKLFGVLGGLLATLLIEWVVRRHPDLLFVPHSAARLFGVPGSMTIRPDAVIRIALSGAVLIVAVILLLRARPLFRSSAQIGICVLIIGQTVAAADVQVNAAPRHASVAFDHGDMYMARRYEFRLPTADQLAKLHARLGSSRVALICNPAVAGGFCDGHVPETWDLKSAGGYYGLGVPSRLRALPWHDGVSLRTIGFDESAALPWDLLGFLHVGHALVVTGGFYTNHAPDGDRFDPDALTIMANPSVVLPRAFLAASAEAVSSPQEAAQKIFDGGATRDVRSRSFVEGLEAATDYAASGEVKVSGQGDRLTFDVSQTKGRRLLVVNDLFFPGWHAFVDGAEVPILAANVFMRAVVLPAAAKEVVMTYEPFVRTRPALWLYVTGLGIFILGLLAAIWIQAANRAQSVKLR